MINEEINFSTTLDVDVVKKRKEKGKAGYEDGKLTHTHNP